MTLAQDLQPVVIKVAQMLASECPQLNDKEIGKMAKDIVKQMTVDMSEALIEAVSK